MPIDGFQTGQYHLIHSLNLARHLANISVRFLTRIRNECQFFSWLKNQTNSLNLFAGACLDNTARLNLLFQKQMFASELKTQLERNTNSIYLLEIFLRFRN